MVHALLCALAVLGYSATVACVVGAISCFRFIGPSYPKLAAVYLAASCLLLPLGVFATVLAGHP